MSMASEPPSLAQTYMRGPLVPHGHGKPLSKEELDGLRTELAAIKKEFGMVEPERAFMDEKDVEWRFGGPPDYTIANLYYLKGKTKNHPVGSLEMIVENLVKTWEMERSHKLDPNKHRSVDPKVFKISSNGGKKYNNDEANKVGTTMCCWRASLRSSMTVTGSLGTSHMRNSTAPLPPSPGRSWRSSLPRLGCRSPGVTGGTSLEATKERKGMDGSLKCTALVSQS